MIQYFVKGMVRLMFLFTGRERAAAKIARELERYLALAAEIDAEAGRRPVRVPAMRGVDEDMRDWSFYMILEHNVIVNRGISAIVQSLARDEEPTGAGAIDMKCGVMPSADPGSEQVDAFRESVEDHFAALAQLPKLRGTRTATHPLFGDLDAHGWNCMFGVHLSIHFGQAEYVVNEVSPE